MTVKYHQNIQNGFQVIERTNGRTNARFIAISIEPFGRGDKKVMFNSSEHEIFPAHIKCQQFGWHFNIYEQGKLHCRLIRARKKTEFLDIFITISI